MRVLKCELNNNYKITKKHENIKLFAINDEDNIFKIWLHFKEYTPLHIIQFFNNVVGTADKSTYRLKYGLNLLEDIMSANRTASPRMIIVLPTILRSTVTTCEIGYIIFLATKAINQKPNMHRMCHANPVEILYVMCFQI